MNAEPVFSRRLLSGWIAGAVVVFALSLYLMGSGEMGSTDSTGPSTFSRSAIGHAGIAEVLQRLGLSVVKSQYNSLEKLSPGSVLVIAEPRPSRQSEEAIRALLKANTILLVLPKWTGEPSEQTAGWLRQVSERSTGDAQWVLNLVAPRAEVVRAGAGAIGSTNSWNTNYLGLAPSLVPPIQLVRGGGLRAIIAMDRDILLGEISERDRRIWVLSDPDLMSNHGLAREGNAALAVALVRRLRAGDGRIVFDETVHGYLARPASPFMLMFRFPFVVATVQGLIAIVLMLWATLARFGAAQSAPPPLRAGREGLLQNIAKLIEYTGHQQEVIRRYISETIRDVARQLHAPRGLSGEALTAWLQRVGAARGVRVDCGALVRQLGEPGEARRRELSSLVRLARDIHGWKGQILDGRSRYSRDR
jgi:hypothetical protein